MWCSWRRWYTACSLNGSQVSRERQKRAHAHAFRQSLWVPMRSSVLRGSNLGVCRNDAMQTQRDRMTAGGRRARVGFGSGSAINRGLQRQSTTHRAEAGGHKWRQVPCRMFQRAMLTQLDRYVSATIRSKDTTGRNECYQPSPPKNHTYTHTLQTGH